MEPPPNAPTAGLFQFYFSIKFSFICTSFLQGRGCLVQAEVLRLKKDLKGEQNALEISHGLPFVEYEIHRQLINKMKVKSHLWIARFRYSLIDSFNPGEGHERSLRDEIQDIDRRPDHRGDGDRHRVPSLMSSEALTAEADLHCLVGSNTTGKEDSFAVQAIPIVRS